MNGNSNEGGGYKLQLLGLSIAVVVSWGIVPTLAKAANMPGGFTAFWVNVFSAIGVFGVMVVFGKWKELKDLSLLPRYVKTSLWWPCVYSLVYFYIIYESTGSLATLMNYTWPLFALYFLSRRIKIPTAATILAIVCFATVAGTLFLEGDLVILLPVIALGLIPASTQGWFNVETDRENRYPQVWLLTLIGALVTVAGSMIWILLFEQGNFMPEQGPEILLPFAIIGVVSNSFGFYAFVKATQLSNRTKASRTGFILAMFLVPFAQVAILFFRVEPDIHPLRFAGIGIVAVGLLVYKLWLERQKNEKPKPRPTSHIEGQIAGD